jgi:hypothetical protein
MDGMRRLIRFTASGLYTYIPDLYSWLGARSTGGSDKAEYCYGMWLKHLTFAQANGMERMPKVFAELGPGDSLGTCICALLSGVEKCYALDVKSYHGNANNLAIFDKLLNMFENRIKRPTKGWPDFDLHLDEELFPKHILTDERLNESLNPKRVNHIRQSVLNLGSNQENPMIEYITPWYATEKINTESVDMLLSHSVMEHVDNIEFVYNTTFKWLKDGGWYSHQVDFTCHGLSDHWNGYRTYSEIVWKLIMGKRLFLINRVPVSQHLSQLRALGSEPRCCMKNMRQDGVQRDSFAQKWRSLSDDDAYCAGLFVQGQKTVAPKSEMSE